MGWMYRFFPALWVTYSLPGPLSNQDGAPPYDPGFPVSDVVDVVPPAPPSEDADMVHVVPPWVLLM